MEADRRPGYAEQSAGSRYQLLVRSGSLFASFLSYSRGQLLVAIALVLAASIFEGVGILLLLPFLEVLLERPDALSASINNHLDWWGFETRNERISLLAIIFIILAALRAIFIWQRDVKLRAMALGYVDHWRCRLFSVLTRTAWQDVLRLQRVELEHALHQDVHRIATITDQSVRAIASVAMLITQITIGLIISPALTSLILLVVGAGVLLTGPFLHRAYASGTKLTSKGRNSVAVLHRFLGGLKLARVHGLEAIYLLNYRQALTDVREESIEFTSQQGIFTQSFGFVAAISACCVVFLGLVILDRPLTEVAIIMVILARISGPVLAILRPLQSLANALPAFDNIERLAGRNGGGIQPYVLTIPAIADHPQEPAGFSFQKVTFAFGQPDEPVVRAVNLAAKPGSLTIVTGPSGSGKTTMVDLLTGLLRPNAGEILIDGKSLLNVPSAGWRQTISYVPQEPFLFDATIRSNLLWDGAERSETELWLALEASCADEFVRQLPRGLETRVGERGAQLSGGERQRLCLARGLVRQPRLLILDEATNALDAKTEREVWRRIAAKRGAMTILAITHRPDLAAAADNFIHLHDGQIIGFEEPVK